MKNDRNEYLIRDYFSFKSRLESSLRQEKHCGNSAEDKTSFTGNNESVGETLRFVFRNS